MLGLRIHTRTPSSKRLRGASFDKMTCEINIRAISMRACWVAGVSHSACRYVAAAVLCAYDEVRLSIAMANVVSAPDSVAA